MKKHLSNKYAIEALKKSLRIKEENKPSGKHCMRCEKSLSYMAFMLSSLCRDCEREIKKQK
jgi:hypothetical protein